MPEMKIVHNITLDMLKPRYEVVNVKQGAELTQWVHADLVVGGSAWTPPSDAVVEVRCKKPDRTTVLYSSNDNVEANGFLISGSSVEVRLHTQTMTCAGKFPVDIAFKKGDETLPLFSFILDVERQAATNDEMASVSYITEALVHASADIEMLDHDDYESTDVIVEQPTNTSIVFHFKVPYGEKGDSVLVESNTYAYATNSSATTPPGRSSSLWKSSPPSSPVAGRYLWTRAIITYENTDAETILYSVSRYGENGSGSPSDDVPLSDISNGQAGSDEYFSRADHRHPLQVQTTGNTTSISATSSSLGGISTTTYAKSDHVHKIDNDSKTLTLSANNWTGPTSGSSETRSYQVINNVTGSDSSYFFRGTGYVYIISPVYSSRDAYVAANIVAEDIAENSNSIKFWCDTVPNTDVEVHVARMVSA